MKKLIWIIIIVLAILGLTFLIQPQQSIAPTDSSNELSVDSEEVIVENDYVRYPGQSSRNAFELLQEVTEVGFQEFGFGVFVKSVNGVTPEEGFFWKLFINGEPSQVGATDLVTQDGDVIEWRIDDIQNSGL